MPPVGTLFYSLDFFSGTARGESAFVAKMVAITCFLFIQVTGFHSGLPHVPYNFYNLSQGQAVVCFFACAPFAPVISFRSIHSKSFAGVSVQMS